MSGLSIFYSGRASENLLRFERISAFFGIEAQLIDVSVFPSLSAAITRAMKSEVGGIVLELQSLGRSANEQGLEETSALLSSSRVPIFLLVTDSDESTARLVQRFSEGRIERVDGKRCPVTVRFPHSGKAFSAELSSHSYARGAKEALTFVVFDQVDVCRIMELDGEPSFVQLGSETTPMFAWSTRNVFDIHKRLVAETEFELTADEYIPAIMFLRYAFGNRCWHNPRIGAGIVIDDPLLKEKYGFINFRELLESAKRNQYHVTLAFIPWNYWRTRRKELQLFLEHSDCFAICPHGCDHTSNEYGLADYDRLLGKNFVVRERMKRHDRRTGLRSASLMICPQEKYSVEAMKAFSDSRQFLGLVCTACMPRNLSAPELTGADLLWPAQDSFFGVPVLKRHYWNGMAIFAMSLFLGKPAILVEHHEFFRDGPRGAEDFVRGLAEMRPNLRWESLEQTFTHTHARRQAGRDITDVRFFTDRFSLEHELEESTHYRFSRRIPAASVPKRVLVGEKEASFHHENGFLTFETHLDSFQNVSVQVEIAPVRSTKTYSPGVKYRASVAVRRGFSEFRDNVIARSQLALKASGILRRSLKRTIG